MELRTYLCSVYKDGPWDAVYASSHAAAASQYVLTEDLRVGDVVFVGVPMPLPEIFSEESLTRFIVDRLGIEATPELRRMTTALAGEANYRMRRYADNQSAAIGRAIGVQEIPVTSDMPVQRRVIA